MTIRLNYDSGNWLCYLCGRLLYQRPFQEPKLEVPTIYRAYVRAMSGDIPPKYALIWYSTSILGSWNSHRLSTYPHYKRETHWVCHIDSPPPKYIDDLPVGHGQFFRWFRMVFMMNEWHHSSFMVVNYVNDVFLLRINLINHD